MSDRSCTCHPSEAPKPCQKRYALTDCQAARIEQLEAELLGEVTELSRRRMQVDNQADRITQLEAEGDKARARADKYRMALEDIAYPNPLHNEDDLMRIARSVLEGK